MSGEMMYFPDEMFKDKSKVYTNGNELIPLFRAEQMVEHYFQRWIPITEALPEPGKYVLLSFENFSLPSVGRYEKDEEGGAFYPRDEDTSYCTFGIIVNAWMTLPGPYRGETE